MEFSGVSDILSCPICLEVSTPPIYQCLRGHLVCKECINDLEKDICPTCRDNLPIQKSKRIRALALEQLASNVTVQCKNAGNGCRKMDNVAAILSHIQTECFHETRNHCRTMGFKCNAMIFVSEVKSHFVIWHGVKPMSPTRFQKTVGGEAYSFNVCQTSSLKNLILDPALKRRTKVMNWRTKPVVLGQDVFSVRSVYDLRTRLFLFTVYLTSSGDVKSLPKVEITMIPDPTDVDDGDTLTWTGRVRTNIAQQRRNVVNPKGSGLCVPLSFLTEIPSDPSTIKKDISWTLQVRIVLSKWEQEHGEELLSTTTNKTNTNKSSFSLITTVFLSSLCLAYIAYFFWADIFHLFCPKPKDPSFFSFI